MKSFGFCLLFLSIQFLSLPVWAVAGSGTTTVSCVELDTQLKANQSALKGAKLEGVSESCRKSIDAHRGAYDTIVTNISASCASAVTNEQSANANLLEATNQSQSAVKDDKSCKDLVFGQAKSAETNQNRVNQSVADLSNLTQTYDQSVGAWSEDLKGVKSACASQTDAAAYQSYETATHTFKVSTATEVRKVQGLIAQNNLENQGMLKSSKSNIKNFAKACWDVAAVGGLAAVLGPKLFESLFGDDEEEKEEPKKKEKKVAETGPPPAPEAPKEEAPVVAENKPQEDLSKLVAGQLPTQCEEKKAEGQEAFDKCVADHQLEATPVASAQNTNQEEGKQTEGNSSQVASSANTTSGEGSVEESQSETKILSPQGRAAVKVSRKPAIKASIGACEEGSSLARCSKNKEIKGDPLLKRVR